MSRAQPAADQTTANLKLKAGKNTLLIKACYVECGSLVLLRRDSA